MKDTRTSGLPATHSSSGGNAPVATGSRRRGHRCHDPEGNGLELYRDRPRDQWTVHADDGRTLRLADPWGTRLAITPER